MPLRSTARTYSQSVSQDSSLPESSSCGAASGRDPSVRAALGGREGREGEGRGGEGKGREGRDTDAGQRRGPGSRGQDCGEDRDKGDEVWRTGQVCLR